MLTIKRSGVFLATRWRNEVLAQREPQKVNLRRGFAAVSFIDQSDSSSAFVDTLRLLAAVLYEDESYITTDGRLRMPRLGDKPVVLFKAHWKTARVVRWSGLVCRLARRHVRPTASRNVVLTRVG